MRDAVAAALQGAAGSVYVGFSGGLDSTVLLHAACSAGQPAALTAVHVDHALHPASATWRAHCQAAAESLGVRFVARRVAVAERGSLEAGARAARYRVFAELLAGRGLLLLAHHRDDQAETVLLRLLQGRGVYGMPAARPLAGGTLVRPLLSLPRSVLADYAAHHRLRWIEDPGNADLGMDRNFLRARVLPALRRRWPDVDATLLSAMARHRQADQLAAAALGTAAGDQSLPLALLRRSDLPAELLRLWLQHAGHPLPTRAALEEFVRQALQARADREPSLGLGDGSALRRHRDTIHCVPAPVGLADAYAVTLPGRLQLPHGELRVEPAGAGFRPQPPLMVRFRQGGERLLSGGRRRTVKQLLQEAGVPPWERDRFPLLYDAHGLLALPGIAERDAGGGGGRYRATFRHTCPPA